MRAAPADRLARRGFYDERRGWMGGEHGKAEMIAAERSCGGCVQPPHLTDVAEMRSVGVTDARTGSWVGVRTLVLFDVLLRANSLLTNPRALVKSFWNGRSALPMRTLDGPSRNSRNDLPECPPRRLGDRQIRIYHPSPYPLPCYSAARAGERGQLNLPIALGRGHVAQLAGVCSEKPSPPGPFSKGERGGVTVTGFRGPIRPRGASARWCWTGRASF